MSLNGLSTLLIFEFILLLFEKKIQKLQVDRSFIIKKDAGTKEVIAH